MKPNIYLSRAFVEFGPFTPEEIIAFEKRGILREIDHIRHHGKDDWIPLATWITSLTAPSKGTLAAPTKKPAVAKKAAAVAKKAAAKKAPAKKAASKKADQPAG
jgi:hypothetical protein